MDTGQIRAVLSRALGESFAGVYPRDLIPSQLKPYEKAIVVNTDPHDRPGKHWVCLYVNSPFVEYFDSYGMPPLHREIVRFMAEHATREMSNPYRYQDWNTSVCGQYCVYYLLQRHKRKKTVREWLLPFPETTPAHRDRYVARWFDQTFHKPQTHYGQTCQCFDSNPPPI